MWDLNTGKVVSTHRAPEGVFWNVAISPDGKSMVGVYGTKEEIGESKPVGSVLYGWDLATGKERFRISHWGGRGVRFSPDGQCLISIAGGEVRVTDATTGKIIHRMRGHGCEWILDCAFSSDGKRLVTGGRDHTAIVWDLSTGKPVLDFESPRGPVDVIAFAPDGKTLFTGCAEDHTGGLWNTDTGKRLHGLVANGKGSPLAAAFTPDGQYVVVGYGQPRHAIGTGDAWTARLWSVSDGKSVHVYPAHKDGIQKVAISPDGKLLATRDWGEKVFLWDISTEKLISDINWGPRNNAELLAFRGANELIGVSVDKTNKSHVVNLISGKTLGRLKMDDLPQKAPRARYLRTQLLAISPAGGQVAAVVDSNGKQSLILCDIASGNVADSSFEVSVNLWSSVAFSPDGKTIAVCERDTVHLFDVNTGKKLRTLNGHDGNIASVVFSPDGKRLATGSWDSTVLVWDLTSKP